MLAPTQPHNANGTISSARLLKSIPSRKRRKLSTDIAAACGKKVGPQQVSCRGGGLGERLRLQGEAVCVSCYRSLSLLPPTIKSNTLNTTSTNVNFTTNPKASGAVVCALCGALTCVICSRQCTSTPLSPESLSSKRTTAIVLNHPGTATDTQNITPRRRKVREDVIESEDAESCGGTGCGRTLCRGCCIENQTTHNYVCLECHGTREQSQLEHCATNHTTTSSMDA